MIAAAAAAVVAAAAAVVAAAAAVVAAAAAAEVVPYVYVLRDDSGRGAKHKIYRRYCRDTC